MLVYRRFYHVEFYIDIEKPRLHKFNTENKIKIIENTMIHMQIMILVSDKKRKKK